MIINSAPQEQAVISNVNEIGEFRIRNSAKAFNILSSGLYANKIRAIVRELSCNAVDSHVAANRGTVPFDVHLPNALEPWFSIRDYGTGLSHDQVTNIYTTYFESTKTESNDFIGALGLGSKSPFSYTDNFTVTAVKDGQRGIYTAFINDQGVPSIALMMEDVTDEPAGVEVKFAVNNQSDFDRFRSEASHVYRYFKLRPVISGCSNFKFSDPIYADQNIVPGVHTNGGNYAQGSVAVMGNIEYPIDVPNGDKTLGNLTKMLECNLVLEFEIGELDFQASREGLSYVPQTVNAIKRKLDALNQELSVHVAREADKIDNLWERAYYLLERSRQRLWHTAVEKYVTDTNFPLVKDSRHSYMNGHRFKLFVKDLADNYNVALKSFAKSLSYDTCETRRVAKDYVPNVSTNPLDTQYWEVSVSNCTHFVTNDTKLGSLERSKYHYRKNSGMIPRGMHSVTVFVIEPANRDKPVKIKEFMESLHNPPESQQFLISKFDQKPRMQGLVGQNVSLLCLEERHQRGYHGQKHYVWSDAGKIDAYDDQKTHYYIPLSGYVAQGVFKDAKELRIKLDAANITETFFGVRKSDLEKVKGLKNWRNIDDVVREKLTDVNKDSVMGMVKSAIDFKELYKHNDAIALIDPQSPYVKLHQVFKDVRTVNDKVERAQSTLFRRYGIESKIGNPTKLIETYKAQSKTLLDRYPLLSNVSNYSTTKEALAEYINAIDLMKGF
jgi:hypothetical protein